MDNSRVYRIRDCPELRTPKQCAFLANRDNPTAASDEENLLEARPLLRVESLFGQIPKRMVDEHGAMLARRLILLASRRVMTDARCRPHIVQRPNDGFSQRQQLPDVLYGKHSLVYPVQMNHIGLSNQRMPADIRPRIGNRDLKQILSGEPVANKYHQTLPNETHPIKHFVPAFPIQRNNIRIIRPFIAH